MRQNHNRFTKKSFKEAHILLNGKLVQFMNFHEAILGHSLRMYRRLNLYYTVELKMKAHQVVSSVVS